MTDADQGGTGGSTPETYLKYEFITADNASGTVTIVSEMPTANLPGILSYPYYAIIDTTVPEGDIIVGTGPYVLLSSQEGIGHELAANEHYWNGEVPYDTVSVIYIDDSATKAMALQSGDIDAVENITTASDLAFFMENSDEYHVSAAAGVRVGNSFINMRSELASLELRQAITMALDSETMANVTVGGMYTPGFSVLPS